MHKRPRALPAVSFLWRKQPPTEKDGKTPNEGETECDSLKSEPHLHPKMESKSELEPFGLCCQASYSASSSLAIVVAVVVLILVGHLRAIIV